MAKRSRFTFLVRATTFRNTRSFWFVADVFATCRGFGTRLFVVHRIRWASKTESNRAVATVPRKARANVQSSLNGIFEL